MSVQHVFMSSLGDMGSGSGDVNLILPKAANQCAGF